MSGKIQGNNADFPQLILYRDLAEIVKDGEVGKRLSDILNKEQYTICIERYSMWCLVL